MNALANRRFLKMNGLGNQITVLDLRGSKHVVSEAEARAIASEPRARFDQLMVLHDAAAPGTDAFVRIYNTDGSEAGACGNGTRCVAWAMIADPQMGDADKIRLTLQTRAGLLPAVREGEVLFTVDMGAPRLDWDEIPLAEPFEDTARFELQIGPLLENHPIVPNRANIELAAVKAPDHIVLRVWERGAGITQACGSGACAALVAGVRRELTARKATVSLPGGDLAIEWRERDGHVLMTGPVEFEWEGTLDPALFSSAA
jgi:diaminopimelate epimerase